MGENESHILTPTDWQALDTTQVFLEIDQGNDGSVDSTATLSQTTNVNYELPKQDVSSFALSQNYPNPFNSQTTIHYQLPQTTHVILKIYNSSGQEIIKLADEDKGTGHYTNVWNGKDWTGKKASSGIYFYRLEMIEKNGSRLVEIKKMLYLK